MLHNEALVGIDGREVAEARARLHLFRCAAVDGLDRVKRRVLVAGFRGRDAALDAIARTQAKLPDHLLVHEGVGVAGHVVARADVCVALVLELEDALHRPEALRKRGGLVHGLRKVLLAQAHVVDPELRGLLAKLGHLHLGDVVARERGLHVLLALVALAVAAALVSALPLVVVAAGVAVSARPGLGAAVVAPAASSAVLLAVVLALVTHVLLARVADGGLRLCGRLVHALACGASLVCMGVCMGIGAGGVRLGKRRCRRAQEPRRYGQRLLLGRCLRLGLRGVLRRLRPPATAARLRRLALALDLCLGSLGLCLLGLRLARTSAATRGLLLRLGGVALRRLAVGLFRGLWLLALRGRLLRSAPPRRALGLLALRRLRGLLRGGRRLGVLLRGLLRDAPATPRLLLDGLRRRPALVRRGHAGGLVVFLH